NCSNGGTVSGPLMMNLTLPLVCASTPLVKASASAPTAGLVLSQLDSRRRSAACAAPTTRTDTANAMPTRLQDMAFLPHSIFYSELAYRPHGKLTNHDARIDH